MVDVDATCRNIVQQLQSDPARYHLFGIYWWPIKAILKARNYHTNQLYMLGDYSDPVTVAMVPKLGLQDMLTAAIAEQIHNATYPHTGGLVENADGELVTVYDEDAGR